MGVMDVRVFCTVIRSQKTLNNYKKNNKIKQYGKLDHSFILNEVNIDYDTNENNFRFT
jgi:hypothetical protein